MSEYNRFYKLRFDLENHLATLGYADPGQPTQDEINTINEVRNRIAHLTARIDGLQGTPGTARPANGTQSRLDTARQIAAEKKARGRHRDHAGRRL